MKILGGGMMVMVTLALVEELSREARQKLWAKLFPTTSLSPVFIFFPDGDSGDVHFDLPTICIRFVSGWCFLIKVLIVLG